MPFGLVSAWNKRRRSKSQDHTDPWVYKPVEFWQLEDQTPQHTKGTMDQFSHSGKWKMQHIHSVKRICLAKEDLAEFIEALCNQERYILQVSFLTQDING